MRPSGKNDSTQAAIKILGEIRQKRTSLDAKTELGEKNETSADLNKSAMGRTGNPTRTETTTKSTNTPAGRS
jgi:hypothetical protein